MLTIRNDHGLDDHRHLFVDVVRTVVDNLLNNRDSDAPARVRVVADIGAGLQPIVGPLVHHDDPAADTIYVDTHDAPDVAAIPYRTVVELVVLDDDFPLDPTVAPLNDEQRAIVLAKAASNA